MSDLFDIPETLSPRLRWMRAHKITVTHLEDDGVFVAHETTNGYLFEGETYDGALEGIAAKLNIKDWRQ